MGGGNYQTYTNGKLYQGRSPRGRGRPPRRRHRQARRSPRGRGRRVEEAIRDFGCGSIPAWAGETIALSAQASNAGVDPRVGGGDPMSIIGRVSGEGRSPRGRGRRACRARSPRSRRSIPAWAGETAVKAQNAHRVQVDPRVGGGDRNGWRAHQTEPGRSPRGRGRHCQLSIWCNWACQKCPEVSTKKPRSTAAGGAEGVYRGDTVGQRDAARAVPGFVRLHHLGGCEGPVIVPVTANPEPQPPSPSRGGSRAILARCVS